MNKEIKTTPLPMDLDILDTQECIRGRYKDILFEIKYLNSSNLGKWHYCYYVTLSPETFSGEIWKLAYEKLKEYGYDESLEFMDFHGGCTYKETTQDSLTIGCDYMHYDDQDKTYTLSDVLCECYNSINCLIKEVGQLEK